MTSSEWGSPSILNAFGLEEWSSLHLNILNKNFLRYLSLATVTSNLSLKKGNWWLLIFLENKFGSSKKTVIQSKILCKVWARSNYKPTFNINVHSMFPPTIPWPPGPAAWPPAQPGKKRHSTASRQVHQTETHVTLHIAVIRGRSWLTTDHPRHSNHLLWLEGGGDAGGELGAHYGPS